jgi:L-alanine-DL-glutamate epimerase-like enolase superfamily enzyme
LKRRDWLKTTGIATAAAALQPLEGRAGGAETRGPASVKTEIVRLNLRHTWTTTMSSSDYRDTLRLRFTRDGLTGIGEGAPIVRYKEDATSAQKAVESVADVLAAGDPRSYRKLLGQAFGRIEGQWAAKAAIDIAVMDWVGQSVGLPLHRLLGIDGNDAPITTFSIGIDTPDVTKQKVREAEPFPVLKIKVGLDTDEPTLEAVRSVTKKPLRLDANEGWKSKEEAVRKINWLESLGAELVEQPLPAAMIEESRWVRSRVHIPIFADEACLHLPDVARVKDAFDGVNVKLDKAGGTLEALRMIELARSLGLKVMLGCMISSSVSITAAAHLSPLVDYADLDGNLLIANDPFVGVRVEAGRLVLPTGPGLGLSPVEAR